MEAFELVPAFAADAKDLDLLAFLHKPIDERARAPYNVGVKTAAQSAVRRRDDNKLNLVGARPGEQARRARISGN